MEEIKIFLAEGENHVRQAIHLGLDHQDSIIVSGQARHAESLLAQIGQQAPNVLLLDWHLPGMNPQRMLPVIRRYCPDTKIIATVLQENSGKIALAYGIDAYLLKGLPPDEFVRSLKEHLESLEGKRERS
jgi:DNA-binding NarL/FixJ family response regulator